MATWQKSAETDPSLWNQISKEEIIVDELQLKEMIRSLLNEMGGDSAVKETAATDQKSNKTLQWLKMASFRI